MVDVSWNRHRCYTDFNFRNCWLCNKRKMYLQKVYTYGLYPIPMHKYVCILYKGIKVKWRNINRKKVNLRNKLQKQDLKKKIQRGYLYFYNIFIYILKHFYTDMTTRLIFFLLLHIIIFFFLCFIDESFISVMQCRLLKIERVKVYKRIFFDFYIYFFLLFFS